VGRDGRLELRFERRQGRSVLVRCRNRLPLQAFAPLDLEDGTAYLMLLNPTGGLVGGDSLTTRIVQSSRTQVYLTTPSATRVYRSAGQPAVANVEIRLGEGASLEYMPDHVIPHAGSIFCQSLRLEMAPRSRAIVWDALAAGRLAGGERWAFDRLDSRTEIMLGTRPALISRNLIRPLAQFPQRLGVMAEFNYAASLVLIAEAFDDWSGVTAALSEELSGFPELWGGVSPLGCGGCIVKLLTRSAPMLLQAQTNLWARARQLLLGKPPFDTRKY
jgi:urease accessory protein